MTENSPRVWFITGTSTGLGRALAELALEKNELVVATARKPSSLEDLAKNYSPDRLLVLPLDIMQEDQIVEAFARSIGRFGRIDVVVNNAGYADLGEVESMGEDQGRAIFETNFWGTVKVTKEAVKVLRHSNPPGVGGRILQISSYLGIKAMPAIGFYSASKFALGGITGALDGELDPAWNIKITLVEPGWIRSECLPKAVWSAPHPAYTNPGLPSSVARTGPIGKLVTWKDTRKCVEVFYKIASLSDPPLHLPVGQDAVEFTKERIAELSAVLEKYETWSEGLEVE